MTNKVKFAPVCPAHVYAAMDVWDKGHKEDARVMGDYFLLLAHDVVANAKAYERIFKEKDCTIIMDNSVIELGTAVDVSILKEACDIVNADVLAIPDVLQDGKATLLAAESFMDRWTAISAPASIELMYIPQGKDPQDYLDCISGAAMADIPADWIGIARNLVPRVFTSRMFPIALAELFFPGTKQHLLGFSGDVLDDVECAKSGFVEGIDSAVPLRMGSAGLNLEKGIIDPGPRGDWWDTVYITDLMMTNLLAYRRLIGEVEISDGSM